MGWLLALDFACVLGDAVLLLGALWALAAGAVRDPTEPDGDAGDEVADASIDATAASLEPAEATSADVVGTTPKENAWNSSTGAFTTGDNVAVTSGLGAATSCETEVDWDETENVSTGEPAAPRDREAPISLDLTAYRTTATPAPTPRSTVRICS